MKQEQTQAGVVPSELASAIARGGPAIATLDWPLGKLNLRARFVGVDAAGSSVWIWLDPPTGPAAHRLLRAVNGGERIQIDFRATGSNYRFTARLARGDGDASIVALQERSGCEEVQRRQAYRAALSDGVPLGIKAWRIPSYAALRDRPTRQTELQPRLVDLSALGMGLILSGKGGDRPAISVEHRVRLVLDSTEGELLLGGTVKHVAALPGDGLRVGLEFRQAEYDVKDRQNLSMIPPVISLLQRAEARALKENTPVAA